MINKYNLQQQSKQENKMISKYQLQQISKQASLKSKQSEISKIEKMMKLAAENGKNSIEYEILNEKSKKQIISYFNNQGFNTYCFWRKFFDEDIECIEISF